MSLTTTPQVKAFLNLPPTNTSQDNWLDSLRIAAEAEIKSFCNQNFESQNYIEFYDGNSQRKLPLRQKPVTSLNHVWVDFQAAYGTSPSGAFAPDKLLSSGADYALEFDRIPPWQATPVSFSANVIRLQTIWSEVSREYYPGKLTAEIGPAFGCIKVDYTAGYPAGYIPQELQIATAMLCSLWRRTLPLGGFVIEERIGEYMYKIDHLRHMPGAYPELGSIFALLNKYKDFAW